MKSFNVAVDRTAMVEAWLKLFIFQLATKCQRELCEHDLTSCSPWSCRSSNVLLRRRKSMPFIKQFQNVWWICTYWYLLWIILFSSWFTREFCFIHLPNKFRNCTKRRVVLSCACGALLFRNASQGQAEFEHENQRSKQIQNNSNPYVSDCGPRRAHYLGCMIWKGGFQLVLWISSHQTFVHGMMEV